MFMTEMLFRLSDSDKAHYYYHDGTLDVRYRESGSFFSFFHSLGRKNLEILIPRSLASNLSEISGDVVSADTTINGLSTKNFYLDTVSGNLTFNGSAERIDSDIVSGDCRITSSVTPQKIDMESVSGDISVSIPGNSEFEAENDSVSGDLTCSFAGTKKDDKFVCGSGINRYDFDTVSGDVEILPVG